MGDWEATNQEVSVDATQTPVREHLEFERICETLEEFEPLPEALSLEHDPADHDDENRLDQLILACLVSPV